MIEYIDKFIDNFDLFCKMLEYDKISKLQKEWFEKLFLNKKELVILQSHRNSYKTTTIILSIILLLIVNPKLTFLIIRKSEELSIQLLYELKKILKKEELRVIFKSLYNIDTIALKETQNILDLGLSKREPSVMAVGLGKNLTGLHFDIIICDDIVTEKDRYSKKERENTKRFFFELKNILKKESDFRKIVLTGTPWHSDDLFAELENKYKQNIFKYNIYETGIFNKNEILELRNSMPQSLFACNYELKHINDEESYFSNLKIDSIDFLNKRTYMHIDPAFQGGDYTAITLCYIENNLFFIRGFCKKRNALDLIEYFLKLITDYNVLRVYIESNSEQGAITKELRKKIMINVISYKETRNKHLKIIENIKKNQDRIILDINSDKEYIEQIINYSDFSTHDDAPDSLASILSFLSNEAKKIFIA